MDVTLARTFLAIAETGSFKEAADRLHVTQSAISMRVKALEDSLGRQLFERSKRGAMLTPAGDQFQRHASAMLRVWQHAQLEISLSEQHTDHLTAGAQISLWEGFLLDWVAWLRAKKKSLAVTATFGTPQDLVERLLEGTIDIVVSYRMAARPGILVEHLMDDEFILVSSEEKRPKSLGQSYVFVNWGPDFTADHAEAYPELSRSGLQLDLGAVAVSYLVNNKASGYFPRRVVQPFLDDAILFEVPKARRFVYPVFVAYPEEHDPKSFNPLLKRLRVHAQQLSR